MIDTAKLAALAAEYDAGDRARVQHLMKVYAFSRLIGQREKLDEQEQNILEAAALLHDIGIHEPSVSTARAPASGRNWRAGGCRAAA